MRASPGAADDRAELAKVAYRALLQRYHRTLDLMSERGLERLEALWRDGEAYADLVRTYVRPGLVLDLGSGAGLPAVVIAAHDGTRPMAWVERRRRRATFLEMVAAGCSLDRVAVFGRDAGEVRADELEGGHALAVTAQGVGGWAQLYGSTRHVLAADATLIARRSPDWEEEVRAFAASVGADVDVQEATRLEGGGTLVALRIRGG